MIEEYFRPGGKLETVFLSKGKIYEERKEQIAYAKAVEEALSKEEVLLIEAGTGVGKTLAYLLPAILWAKKENKKVFVSTYTKILQDQLNNQDLPLAKEILSNNFSAKIAYGQDNYLCQRRIRTAFNYQLFDFRTEAKELERVYEWAKSGKGLLLDYPQPLAVGIKEKISRAAEICLGKKCRYYSECFYQKAREEWFSADLLVVNHALFFTNLIYQFLPSFDAVIFDEAHSLEDVCAQAFGTNITENRLKNLCLRFYNPKSRQGFLKFLPLGESRMREANQLIAQTLSFLDNFFTEVRRWTGEETQKRLKSDFPIKPNFITKFERLGEIIKDVVEEIKNEELATEISGWVKELDKLRKELENFFAKRDDNFVKWVANDKGVISLKSSLIDVSPIIETYLLKRKIPIIFTSATLAVNREFIFFENRLGIRNEKRLRLPSPFDYSKQALVYIERNIPLPSEEESFYYTAARVIDDIVKHTKGRTLVLFTSYKALRRVYELCDKSKYRFLIQEENPPSKLLTEFREDVSSVLFATGSFWQGIDVPGETLSSLIIVRLPFDVPLEPRVEGIKERLEEKGIDAFWHYQLPNAVLRFRQGFGRLIRNQYDYGVIVILDKRIIQKHYGRIFLNSLPETVPITDNINAVIRFLKYRTLI